jgi:hypothetical protein
MSDARRGLPLTKSHSEKIFPKLKPVQINRIAIHGRMRSVQSGEVLTEQGGHMSAILSHCISYRVQHEIYYRMMEN